MPNCLYPYNHANRDWRPEIAQEYHTYPMLELTEQELHERIFLINPVDMRNAILRTDTAMNPETPLRLLELLGRDETFLVRFGVTSNPAAPEELVNRVKPTVSRYMLTESFRGWRDLYSMRGSISPEKAMRLTDFPEIYPGRLAGSSWLLDRIPTGFYVPRDIVMHWISSGYRRLHHRLIGRNDLLGPHDLWFTFIGSTDQETRELIQFDKRVPDEVRAYVALLNAQAGVRHSG